MNLPQDIQYERTEQVTGRRNRFYVPMVTKRPPTLTPFMSTHIYSTLKIDNESMRIKIDIRITKVFLSFLGDYKINALTGKKID